MSRSLFHWLLVLFLFGFALGCPPPSDDDDSSDDDDMADDDDDDDDDDPCLDVTDITNNVAGDNYIASTVGETDDFQGSCSAGNVPDELLLFVAPTTSQYAVSTAHEVTGDFDTLIYAFTSCEDSLATELACNDDLGGGIYASEITFDAEEGQTIYIAVEGYDSAGAYELSVFPAVCGDGLVVGTEGCDDGNTEDGDGCDSSCQWECGADDAFEDNDSLEEATPITESGSIEDLFLCTTDLSTEFEGFYIDAFSVEVAEGEYLEAALQPGGDATDCSATTASLVLLDSEAAQVGADAEELEEGECPQALAEPGEGTYYIVVYGTDPQAAPQSYGLSVSLGVSVCGDGTLEGLEECDDGNLLGGDGCAATCVVEDASCPDEGDISAILTDGTHVQEDSSFDSVLDEPRLDLHTPSCTAPGSPEVVYYFTATETAAVIVSTDHAGTNYDTALHVRSDCLDPSSEVACNDDIDVNGGNYNAALAFVAEAGSTYAILVDGYNGDAGDFELSLDNPTCGDGTQELGEECDDGNLVDGDGCDSDCTPTPVCAVAAADEDLGTLPSGVAVEATVTVTSASQYGALSCSGADSGDLAVAFEVTAAGSLTIEYSFADPADIQVQLFADDAECSSASDCQDIYPATENSLTVEVEPGNYLLALEAYADGTEGEVALSITAP